MVFVKTHAKLDNALHRLYKSAEEITSSYAPRDEKTAIVDRRSLDDLIESVNQVKRWMGDE